MWLVTGAAGFIGSNFVLEQRAAGGAAGSTAGSPAVVSLDSLTYAGNRENLALAKKLANEDPRVVAQVIKAWIGTND